ncbi:MAG: alpha/beta fold hydrolase [Alphaproteobacteria bacterium]|nr:alpha/beta fold hydrolase [Alphaproteobacteria bacterium]
MSWAQASGRFALGDFALLSGQRIKGAVVSWKTHGTLSPGRDNAVLYPTSYSAQHPDLEWLIGPDRVLDPTRWFIVIPDMFGNGLSSSPSTMPDYPDPVASWDNVQAQRILLERQFGIARLHGVYGWSMGAQQAYHWAAMFPDAVARAVVNCGSARTSVHNQVFLASLMATLEAAPEHAGGGRFAAEPKAAMRAFGRIYAGWALSQDFYRAGLHRSALGAPDLETFLRTDWEERFARRRAADLYAQLRTWFAGDISANPMYGGDLAKALGAIRARVLLMPGATDLYFRVADNEAELKHLRQAELTPIPSIWGHRAGNPVQNQADAAFIRAQVRRWLDS